MQMYITDNIFYEYGFYEIILIVKIDGMGYGHW